MIALLEPFILIARVVLLVIMMFDKEQVQSVVLYVVKKRALQMKKQKHSWYVHQSNTYKDAKYCNYKGCPGRNAHIHSEEKRTIQDADTI